MLDRLFFLLVLTAIALGSVNSAHALGTVNPEAGVTGCHAGSGKPYTYSWSGSMAGCVQSLFPSGSWTTTGLTCSDATHCSISVYYTQYGPTYVNTYNYWATGTSGSYCPSNSSGTAPNCTCNVGYVVSPDGNSCVVQSLTPKQQAAQDAKNAALAAGHSAAAAQSASDAVETWYDEWNHCAECLSGIGAQAATSYSSASSGGLPADYSSQIAAAAARDFQGGLRTNLPLSDSAQYANRMTELSVAEYQAKLASSGLPNTEQRAAILAAATLAGGAMLSAVTGGASLAVAMQASAALHAAALAVNVSSSNQIQTAAVQSALVGSVGTTSNPFTVTLAAQASSTASQSASNETAATKTGTATIYALTAPDNNWVVPVSPTTSQVTRFNSVSQAAADAAVSAANSGMTQAVVNSAAQAAANVVASGFSSTDAAVAGQIAAATGSSSAGVAAVAGIGASAAGVASGVSAAGLATEETLKSLADKGTPPQAEAISQEIISPNFSPIIFSSPSGCPAPVAYSFMGANASVSYQPVCDFMTAIRPIVLAIAAGMVAWMFLGFFA